MKCGDCKTKLTETGRGPIEQDPDPKYRDNRSHDRYAVDYRCPACGRVYQRMIYPYLISDIFSVPAKHAPA